MDYLIENNFNLLISLDGNEQNNSYRVFKNGKQSFKITFKNALSLKKKNPGYFSRFVNFNSVLHNKNSVSDIYYFFKNNFDKIPMIGSLNTSGIKESLKKEFWEKYRNINESLYQSENYSFIEKEIFVNLPNVIDLLIFLHRGTDFCFKDYNELMYTSEKPSHIPTGTCLPFSKKIFVTVNGNILPCERINQRYSFGYVTSDTVELDFEKISDKYNNYLNKMKKLCQVCHKSDNCIQCIFNLDTIESKKPVCNGLLSEKDYAKYLNSLLNQVEDDPSLYSKILNEVIVA